MAIAFVRQTAANPTYSAGSAAVTLSAAAASGNYLVAFIAHEEASTSASTISSISTTNVTWTKLGATTFGGQNLDVWLGAVSATSGTSVTVNLSTTSGTTGINIAEFSGVTAASPVDVTGVVNNNFSSTATTTAYTTLTANDVVLACCATDLISTGTLPTPSGYTALTPKNNTVDWGIAPYYKLGAAAASQSASWALGVGTGWDTILVALKPLLVVQTSSGHGVGVSLGRATGSQTQIGNAHGVGVSLSKSASTKVISSSGHGLSVSPARGTLEKYFGSMRGLGISLGRATATAIRTSSAHGVGVSLAAGALLGSTRIGKGHGKGIGVAKGQIKKLTLPPPSSAAIRIGPWTRIPPSG